MGERLKAYLRGVSSLVEGFGSLVGLDPMRYDRRVREILDRDDGEAIRSDWESVVGKWDEGEQRATLDPMLKRRSLSVKIVRDTRDLLEDAWVHGAPATIGHGHCLLTGLSHSVMLRVPNAEQRWSTQGPIYGVAAEVIDDLYPGRAHGSMTVFNDHPETTKADVDAVLAEVEKRLEKA